MNNREDYGHQETERRLWELEQRIEELYRQAVGELEQTIAEYFAAFQKRDEEMKALVSTGKVTQEHYRQWRLNQIGRGERFQHLRQQLAQRMTNANETATAYVKDITPGLYTLNRNYAAYTIEQAAGDVGFTLWDEQTVKRLVAESPELLPHYPAAKALKRGIDLKWGKKQITDTVTSAILQGKNLKAIADSLQNRLEGMNRASAIRTARTAVTGAENAGRLESYSAAEKMGIALQKEWIATLDGRTRHSHAMLDGEQVPNKAEFSNGCRFPGDPQGPPHEVYN